MGIDITIYKKSSQTVHAMAKVHSQPSYWILRGIYASPIFNAYMFFFRTNSLFFANSYYLSWVLLGDFNDITNSLRSWKERVSITLEFLCLKNLSMIAISQTLVLTVLSLLR